LRERPFRGIAKDSVNGSPAPARLLRILLAEDTPANQKLVCHILGSRGHEVRVAHNGQQAVDLVAGEDFDAVLMDVQMPTMDGLQAAEKIRKLNEPTKARVPIIAMTAHAMKGDKERCLAAGMDDYLSKPVNSEVMIELVERLAAGAGPRPSRVEEPRPSEEPAPPEPGAVFHLEGAIARCLGKRGMFEEMVRFFHEETANLLPRLFAAIGDGNTEELAYAAHRLRGTILYLAAPSVLEAVEHVEKLAKSGDLTTAPEAFQRLEHQAERLKQALAAHRRG
jgi:two-component system, sensor histidine kinase and response regulator